MTKKSISKIEADVLAALKSETGKDVKAGHTHTFYVTCDKKSFNAESIAKQISLTASNEVSFDLNYSAVKFQTNYLLPNIETIIVIFLYDIQKY